jgi:hypothetical protein
MGECADDQNTKNDHREFNLFAHRLKGRRKFCSIFQHHIRVVADTS